MNSLTWDTQSKIFPSGKRTKNSNPAVLNPSGIPLKSLQHPRAQLGFDPPHTAPHSKSSNQSYKAPDLSKLQSA
ncbi:hypothetical protein PCANC_01899 [Puccinia coronata f. sp. avenae]|uniref:Uncharacterized protein n=1 Tax=Puccinia coronata f. sp. avenae TaxID=200324 RepID=A0A2N5W4E0_9BASI|nr:hypothetical protein PCANC_01899 [Puccinia coronata f. sp. avenae]